MPTTLDSFTKSSSIADTDRLVGYTNTNSGGERSWPFSALKNAVATTVGPSVAKAWVNFNGQFGTSPFTTTNGGIRDSYNISSITDNGTGDYTINFGTALSNSNYSVVGTTIFSNVSRTVGIKAGTTLNNGNFTIITTNDPNFLAPVDPEIVCLQVFGN
jgi:hypothetical protein